MTNSSTDTSLGPADFLYVCRSSPLATLYDQPQAAAPTVNGFLHLISVAVVVAKYVCSTGDRPRSEYKLEKVTNAGDSLLEAMKAGDAHVILCNRSLLCKHFKQEA